MDEWLLFRIITGQAGEMIPVCRLSSPIQAALGAHTGAVWLSPETCRKTEVKHHHPQLELYRRAPAIIESGTAYRLDERRLLFTHEFSSEAGKYYRAVVKRTIDCREVYLVSVSRMRSKQMLDVRATLTAVG
jgi:hypothetical protein